MATIPVGQVLHDAFGRAIPVIEDRCGLLDIGKRRVCPARVLQPLLINTQLLMPQR